MEKPILGLLYLSSIDPEDIGVLRKEFEDRLLPLARSIGVIAPDESPRDLLRRNRSKLASPDDSVSTNPKEIAARALASIEASLRAADALQKEPWEDGPDDFPDWIEFTHDAGLLIPHTYGYLCALSDLRQETIKRGAHGRRLIGATTREKARIAAQQYRGKLSRDMAALRVAGSIGKAPATVRRLLSELFPGDAWSAAESDESTDLP